MKRFVWIFTTLAFTLPAMSQESAKPVSDQRAMYQDIEVMRAILLRRVMPNCMTCHDEPFAGGNSFMGSGMGGVGPMGSSAVMGGPVMGGGVAVSDFDNDGRLDIFLANHPHGNSVGLGGVEGAYVKGQGVIFQATVPVVPAKEMKLSGTPQSPKSLSDWEKTLLEIRGEKATTAAQKQQSTLADKLIQSLAENGKNFTHLSDNENLTIVVTFRGGKSTAQSGGGVAAGGMMGSLGGKGGMGPLAGGGGMAGPGGGMPMAPSAGTGGIGSPLGGIGPMGSGAPPGATGGEAMTPDRELELLGDLHQKRGNWSDAASAYERALKTAGGAARARELAKKLAEVYLKNGDLEKARKALDATSGKAPRVKVQGEIKEVVAKPAIKLPTRLIISATKKLLDQVGSGKITLTDFKKQATFEVLNFDETSAPKK